MSNTPSTPVKVPPSAANHSAATLDPDLRSQINALLLKDGHVQKIQETLLHALHSNSSDWPTQVQSHALHLLRSGEASTFPALLTRVLEDVRSDTLNQPSQANSSSHSKTNGADHKDKKATNGVSAASSASGTPAASAVAAGDQKPSLAIPPDVVEEMLKVTRDSLDAVCEIEDGDGS